MAPPPIAEDYYAILCVQQDATSDQIKKSYHRLALKVHPDRKAEGGSTQAFQLLGKAYETLNDENKRRAYDRIYPSLKQDKSKPQGTQPQKPSPPPPPPPPPPSSPPPTSTPRSELHREAAQIAALRKAREERNARSRVSRIALESSIFELKRSIRRLKQDIENLVNLEADESVVGEGQRRPWSSSAHLDDSEEEKARQDRIRQERWMAKNLKERRLDAQEGELLEKENEILRAKKRLDAENLRDDQAIEALEARQRRGEARGHRSGEQEEQQRQEKIRREQYEQRRAQEELRKKQEKQRRMQEEQRRMQEEERKKQEEQRKKQEEQRKKQEEQRKKQEEQRKKQDEQRKQQDEQRKKQEEQWTREELAEARAERARQEQEEQLKRQRDCDHRGWWGEDPQRAPCSKCHDVWNYLLQCPSCQVKACPKCQRDMRPKFQRR